MRRLLRALALAAAGIAGTSLQAQRPAPARSSQPRTAPPPAAPQAAVPSSVAATDDRPGLLLAASGDTVLVLFPGGVFGMPRVTLTRESSGQPAVSVPVPAPVRDADSVEALLGVEWPAVRELMRVADGGDLLRELDRDPVAASLLSSLFRPIGRVTGRAVVDAGLVRGREYTYRAQFLDARGRPRGAPLVARLTVTDPVLAVPAAPTVRGVGGTGAVVTVPIPRRSGPADRIIAYVLERSDDGGAWRRHPAGPVVRQYGRDVVVEEPLLAPGVRYQWRLRAVDLSGREGPPSPVAALTLRDDRAPEPVTETVARADSSRVLVTWSQSPEPDAAGYHVERSASLSGPWTRLTAAPLAVNAPQFADSTAPVRVQHFWRVRAVDRTGNVGLPGSPAPATRADLDPPGPVTALAARAERGAMLLSWTLPPAKDLVGVHVWRGEDTTRLSRLTDAPVRGTTWRDAVGGARGVAPGGRYVYRVVAIDSSRNASPAAELAVTVPDAVRPPAPPSVSARDVGGRYVEVSWLPSSASDVARYVVTRRPAGTPSAIPAARPGARPAAPAAPVREDTVSRTDGGRGPFAVRDSSIAIGARYEYRVAAVDAAGNAGVPAAAVVTVSSSAPPPAPRFAAAALRAGGGVAVRWERVVDDALAGYVVYRGATPTGPFVRVTGAPVRELSIIDAAGTAASWYVVRAVDAAGRESLPSPPVRGVAR